MRSRTGTRDVLVVGDCKMAALETRGHMTAYNSRYLCRLYAPWAAREIAGWIENALEPERRASWELLEEVDGRTGEIRLVAEVDTHQREQSWSEGVRGRSVKWTERVLLVRSQAYWLKERANRERALAKLVAELGKLCLVPSAGRGRRRYGSQGELEVEVTKRIAAPGFEGVVHALGVEVQIQPGQAGMGKAARKPFWVEHIAVDPAAWERYIDRLRWQVCLTSTTAEQCSTRQVLETYHGHERSGGSA